ncbi:MAG: hypothetical protein L0387_07735 [Acidobacteria bacterium]|nr:hypothetical protein [Acidobacteriota bacterium]
MEYVVVKSGLEIFDTARAYGLAQLLQVLAQGKASPTIADRGGIFLLSLPTAPSLAALKTSDLWRAVFGDNNWQRVFLTYKKAWSLQRDKVRNSLEGRAAQILVEAERNGLTVGFDGKYALPGPLDPVGFKGLKGLTASSYSEGQTTVDELNWALGCVGGAVSQRYKIQKAVGNKWEYYATIPVPGEVRFNDFHEVRQLVYDKGLSYNGVRNAAAHFSLLLADAIREKSQGNPYFPVRFSTVHYFLLFQSGQQFKPSIGGAVNVSKLVEIALSHPHASLEMFKTWDYLFRRGSTQGGEDLGLAITELVMTPSLETFYHHARIFNRYIVDRNKGVRQEHLYSERALEEVMRYVQ